jgi:hypothetical protein
MKNESYEFTKSLGDNVVADRTDALKHAEKGRDVAEAQSITQEERNVRAREMNQIRRKG